MERRLPAWLAALLPAAHLACAHAPATPSTSAEELRTLREEVRSLRAEREQDRRRIRALEAVIASATPSGRPAGPAESSAPIAIGLERSLPGISSPPIVPDLETIRLVPEGGGDDEEDSFVFIADGGSGSKSQAPATPRRRTGGPETAPDLPVMVALADPEALARSRFEEGVDALDSGEAEKAIELLEAFVRASPRDSRADNAILAIGGAWLGLDKPGNALQAFERVVREYPAGDVVPEALLRYGETCRTLGREAAARAAFERLLRDHPASIAATRAELHLAAR